MAWPTSTRTKASRFSSPTVSLPSLSRSSSASKASVVDTPGLMCTSGSLPVGSAGSSSCRTPAFHGGPGASALTVVPISSVSTTSAAEDEAGMGRHPHSKWSTGFAYPVVQIRAESASLPGLRSRPRSLLLLSSSMQTG